ncbi:MULTISPECIES: hypothetical protein [unclassified Eikenella]|uniref:hypothetical protein n=1 Tax=unclassified Eikenella TaxID=2639367 RepID=UPI000B256C30|nr:MULTISPECIES: hypothetical protein [unclassified Eikenella]
MVNTLPYWLAMGWRSADFGGDLFGLAEGKRGLRLPENECGAFLRGKNRLAN